jgi:hypothetical protein
MKSKEMREERGEKYFSIKIMDWEVIEKLFWFPTHWVEL